MLRRLSLVLGLLAPVSLGQSALEPALQRRVNEAIDRGVDALLAQQELDGSWRAHQDPYPSGMTALSAYALIKSGLPRDHQALRRAFGFLRNHPPEKTYSASCQLLAWVSWGDPDEDERVEELAELLLSWHKSGIFGYPNNHTDLSNTQYAVLGLRAATQAGVDISDSFWDLVADRVMELQESFADELEPAGFAYRGPRVPSASMTAAGVCCLAICKEQGVTNRRIEQSLGVGLSWLAREFTVTENRPHGFEHLYYYLYGLERVGGILGLERIGVHDWYAVGAQYLVDQQEGDGRWFAQPQTAFALLFLTKATAPMTGEGARRGSAERSWSAAEGADVRLRASGSSPLSLWIDSFGPGASGLEWVGEAGQGPRVLWVEYRTRNRGEDFLLARVEGEASSPARGERFPAQHVFALPGTYAVYASVTVLRQGFDPGDPAGERVLQSPPVRVRVPQAWNEELLEYSLDPARNLLAGVEARVSASSSWSDDASAARAVDNRQASTWRSSRSDTEIWWQVEVGKSLRANTLLLSHARSPLPMLGDPGQRLVRVSIRVNGSRTPIEVDLVPDDWRKTVVPFERTMRVKKLEIRVLEGEAGGGFAEVELQLRKGGKRGG